MPAFAVPADFANKISGLGNLPNNIPSEISEKINNANQSSTNNSDNNTSETTEESGDAGSAQTPEIHTKEGDPEIDKIFMAIADLGWCPDDDTQVKNSYKQDLCKQFKSVEVDSYSNKALDENTRALEENYQAMQDKETSFENRMLGAAGIGTVGIGGMMAASALAEQNADKNADADMQAYLSTFSCTYPGGNAKGGQTGIELPGANQLIGLYTQYVDLANDLKERKTALGLTPGIESEIILDKANMNLYDNDSNGIENGTYASLYRASKGNTQDINKINKQKESTSKQLKIGAGVAAAGAIATTAANYAINHDNKNKSDELLAERQKLLKDKYAEVSKILVDECNKKIRDHKEYVKTLTPEQLQIEDIKEYKDAVDAAHEIKDVSEITDSKFCR